jgi:DNA-binding NarL/FixJ family response regulator
MPKSNSSKKNDTKSSKPVVEEKLQEQVTIEKITPKRSPRGHSKRNKLTPRQEQVLKLLVEGMSNKEIAESLKISVKTIDAHRAFLMVRLQIHDLAGLVKYAVRTNLTSND